MLIISRIIKNLVPVLAKFNGGISLVVQWLRICLSTQGQMFNPWGGVKIPHAKRQLSLKATIREAHAMQGRAHTLQRRPSAAKKKAWWKVRGQDNPHMSEFGLCVFLPCVYVGKL